MPFSTGHSAFVEENFILEEESGVSQRVPETPRGHLQPPEKAGPPVAEPPVKNLLSASAPERGGKQAPAASESGARTPEAALVPDGDDAVTRINPRGRTFLGEMVHTPAKGEAGDAYEVAPVPPAESDDDRQQPGHPAKPPQPKAATQASQEEAKAQGVEEESIHSRPQNKRMKDGR